MILSEAFLRCLGLKSVKAGRNEIRREEAEGQKAEVQCLLQFINSWKTHEMGALAPPCHTAFVLHDAAWPGRGGQLAVAWPFAKLAGFSSNSIKTERYDSHLLLAKPIRVCPDRWKAALPVTRVSSQRGRLRPDDTQPFLDANIPPLLSVSRTQ